MKALFKILAILIAILVAVPLVAYATYDFTQFRPYRKQIDTIVSNAAPDERDPPAQLVGLLKVSSGKALSAYASRLLLTGLDVLPRPMRNSEWQMHEILWWSLLRLHRSEAERITLVLTLSPTGSGRYGASNTANMLFGKKLSELSLEEAATVVLLIKAPTYASRDPARLERLKSDLLERYRTQTPDQASIFNPTRIDS